MKKLSVVIMFLVFLILPLSANAGSCEHYWDELVGQHFEVTIDEVTYTLFFEESPFGPCPGGQAVLSYIDIQVIDGIEYEALIEANFDYLTDYNYVTIAGLDFILMNNRLILMPDVPLIFEKEKE